VDVRPSRGRTRASWKAALAAAALAAAGGARATAAAPSIESVQAAYDAARVENAERHAFDLVIQDAKCIEMKAGGYACQVDFVRRTAPEQRLYFDVVTLDERAGQWVLLSGLCVTKSR
jgi:hypothetical protein